MIPAVLLFVVLGCAGRGPAPSAPVEEGVTDEYATLQEHPEALTSEEWLALAIEYPAQGRYDLALQAIFYAATTGAPLPPDLDAEIAAGVSRKTFEYYAYTQWTDPVALAEVGLVELSGAALVAGLDCRAGLYRKYHAALDGFAADPALQQAWRQTLTDQGAACFAWEFPEALADALLEIGLVEAALAQMRTGVREFYDDDERDDAVAWMSRHDLDGLCAAIDARFRAGERVPVEAMSLCRTCDTVDLLPDDNSRLRMPGADGTRYQLDHRSDMARRYVVTGGETTFGFARNLVESERQHYTPGGVRMSERVTTAWDPDQPLAPPTVLHWGLESSTGDLYLHRLVDGDAADWEPVAGVPCKVFDQPPRTDPTGTWSVTEVPARDLQDPNGLLDDRRVVALRAETSSPGEVLGHAVRPGLELLIAQGLGVVGVAQGEPPAVQASDPGASVVADDFDMEVRCCCADEQPPENPQAWEFLVDYGSGARGHLPWGTAPFFRLAGSPAEIGRPMTPGLSGNHDSSLMGASIDRPAIRTLLADRTEPPEWAGCGTGHVEVWLWHPGREGMRWQELPAAPDAGQDDNKRRWIHRRGSGE